MSEITSCFSYPLCSLWILLWTGLASHSAVPWLARKNKNHYWEGNADSISWAQGDQATIRVHGSLSVKGVLFPSGQWAHCYWPWFQPVVQMQQSCVSQFTHQTMQPSYHSVAVHKQNAIVTSGNTNPIRETSIRRFALLCLQRTQIGTNAF